MLLRASCLLLLATVLVWLSSHATAADAAAPAVAPAAAPAAASVAPGAASPVKTAKTKKAPKAPKPPKNPPVTLYTVNHKETFSLRLRDAQGKSIKGNQRRFDRFLRCHHTEKKHAMNPRLMRLLYQTGATGRAPRSRWCRAIATQPWPRTRAART